MAIGTVLLAFLITCAFSVTASAAADSLRVDTAPETKTPFVDRLAVRTNALDWLLTVPNIGVEFDLSGSEFNAMTVGVSAKYNWNTYHAYTPPTVFNLLDVRPEFRYYFRTRVSKKRSGDPWTMESFLKDRKVRKDKNGNAIGIKSWRAHYVGAYVNYGTYAFKFGQKGMQGNAIGLGLSTGYSIPMYEYRDGAIDVELGLSLGFQVCSRDMFLYDPYGGCYTRVKEGSRDPETPGVMGFTPFPVVSDVRVAFVWRHKSIKDKVKEDVERAKVERYYNGIYGDYNYKDFTKASYDEFLTNTKSSKERRDIMANDSLYRAGFEARLAEQEATLMSYIPNAFPGEYKTDPRVYEIVKTYEAKLESLIVKRKKKAIKDFEADWAKAKSEGKKAADQAAKEKEKAAKEAEKAAEKQSAGQPEDEKADKEKPEKVKKQKDPKPEKVKEPKAEKVKEPKPEKVKEPKPEKVKEPKQKKEDK